MTALLVIGLFFPLLSIVTLAACCYEWKVNKRHCSSVSIPYIGPVLLTAWMIMADKPLWLLPLPWLLDPGTVMFTAAVLPDLLKELMKKKSSK